MVNYKVIINKTNVIEIKDVSIFNNDELANIDKDILAQSISDSRIESEEDIRSFASECDEVNAYYSSQTAKQEFQSYMNLSKAEKVNDYTINLNGELM